MCKLVGGGRKTCFPTAYLSGNNSPLHPHKYNTLFILIYLLVIYYYWRLYCYYYRLEEWEGGLRKLKGTLNKNVVLGGW